MSTTLDQRVVEMQFDNRQFERGVSTTMDSLDKLDNSLKLTGATKGLEGVGEAAKRINLSGLTNAADAVVVKFSYMQMAIQHQLNNLVDSAISTGKRMASALTIDPIKTGFQEYETQINAVQTILANTQSKGKTINDVNYALDELNTYADKTIYNFTEMTRNIGTFTAAGVDLDKAVTSIKGIANLAAVSGSTSQQASTAMYQLSQALASGKVSLMDWNSVVNAGMGGQVFQDALKRTATQMGKDVDGLIERYGSFRESLTQGNWLTAEVLTETLTQLSGAYTEADLIEKGYSEAQAKEIMNLADTAVNAATKVKTFTQLWDTLKESAQSGWTQSWEIIVGDFEEAKEALTKVSDVIGEMINTSSQKRIDLLSGTLDTNWEKLTKKIEDAGIASTDFEEKLRSTMKDHGLDVDALVKEHGSLEKVFRSGAASSDILKEAIGNLSTSMGDLLKVERVLKRGLNGDDTKRVQEALIAVGYDTFYGADGIYGQYTEATVKKFQEDHDLEITGIIDEKTLNVLEDEYRLVSGIADKQEEITKALSGYEGLVDAITELGGREKMIEAIKNAFNGLMNIVKPIKKALEEVFPPITVEQLSKFIDVFRNLTASFAEFTAAHHDQIYNTFKGLFSILDIGWTLIKKLAGGFFELISNFTGVGSGVLGLTSSFGNWLSSLRDTVKETDIFGIAIDTVVGYLTAGINAIKNFGNSVKEAFNAGKYNGFIGFLQGVWDIIKWLGEKAVNIFSAITDGITAAFGETSLGDALNSGLLAGILAGIMQFSDSLKKPFESLAGIFEAFADEGGFLDNITGMLDDVRGCFQAYQDQLKAGTLKQIAIAIGIMAAAIWVLSTIDGDEMDDALGGLTVTFIELIGALAILSKLNVSARNLASISAAMISMSAALLILAAAMKIMGSMSLEEIAIAIMGVCVGVVALVGSVALLDNKRAAKAAKALSKISIALVIFAAALKIMGTMSIEQIGVAIMGVCVGIMALVGAVNALPKDSGLRTLGLISLATALLAMVGVIKLMAMLEWGEMIKGIAGIGGSLAAIVLAIRNLPKDAALRSAGLLGVATAMVVLGAALKIMGSMNNLELITGLAAMGMSLLMLSYALNSMQTALPGAAALLVASAALAILTPVLKTLGGMSIGEIAKALITLAAGFAVIGVAGWLLAPLVPVLLSLSGAMALFALATVGIGVGLLAISAGFSALATATAAGATAIVAALSIIIIGIVDLIPLLVDKLAMAIVALCEAIIIAAPKLVETIVVVVAEVLEALVAYTPQIVESLMLFVIGILDGFAAKLPQLIVSVVNVIMAFFQGVVDALSGLDTDALLKGVIGVGILAALMYALSMVAALVPGAMVGVLGMGVVIAELALVLAAIGLLAQIPGLSWLIEEGGQLLQKVGEAIGMLIGGIVGGFMGGVSGSFPQIATNLSAFMENIQPFIDGAKNIDPSMMEGVRALADTILVLTAANLLEGIASFITGSSSIDGFGEKLGSLGSGLNAFAANLGVFDETKLATITCAAAAIKTLAQAASEIPNEGGWAAAICGENSLASFGEQLPAVATNLAAFATNLGTFDESRIAAVTNAANCIKVLAQAAGEIDGQADWTKGLFGDNGFAKFSEDLPTLGTNLSAFATNLGAFDEATVTSITCAANAVKAMAQASEGIDGQADWTKSIFGDNGLGSFSSQFGTLGSNLNAFVTNLGTFTNTQVSTVRSAINAVKAFAELAGSNLSGAKANIGGFGDKLPAFGSNIGEFVTNMPSSESLSGAIAGVNRIITAIEAIANCNSGVLSTFANNLKKLGDGAVDKFIGAFTSTTAKTDIKTAAKDLADSAIDGIESKNKAATTAGETLASKAVDGIGNLEDDGETAGKDLGRGLVNGIKGKWDDAYNAGYTLGQKAVQGEKDGQQSNSPSKLTTLAGKWLGEGLIIGIKRISGKVYDASHDMGSITTDAISSTVSKLADIVGSDIDAQPTIRPVLDLSDVRTGAEAITDMLGVGPSVGVLSSVGSINSAMNRRSQNATNDDVVFAINKLGKQLDSVGNTTYSIDGVTYDDGSNIADAVRTITRAAIMERRM